HVFQQDDDVGWDGDDSFLVVLGENPSFPSSETFSALTFRSRSGQTDSKVPAAQVSRLTELPSSVANPRRRPEDGKHHLGGWLWPYGIRPLILAGGVICPL